MAFQRTSSIPQVKAAVKTKFTTWLATSGVDPNNAGQIQVAYNWAVPNPERECVLIGDTAAPAEQRWHMLGGSLREETYDLAFEILVARPAGPSVSQQTVFERAFTILAVLETQLRAQDPLGLNGSTFESLRVEIATPDPKNMPTREQFVCSLACGLRVVARI